MRLSGGWFALPGALLCLVTSPLEAQLCSDLPAEPGDLGFGVSHALGSSGGSVTAVELGMSFGAGLRLLGTAGLGSGEEFARSDGHLGLSAWWKSSALPSGGCVYVEGVRRTGDFTDQIFRNFHGGDFTQEEARAGAMVSRTWSLDGAPVLQEIVLRGGPELIVWGVSSAGRRWVTVEPPELEVVPEDRTDVYLGLRGQLELPMSWSVLRFGALRRPGPGGDLEWTVGLTF